MNKLFIITVDTEGDNLWEYKKGGRVKTQNVFYIHRFQELCEKYGFKPVYLSNYEMISSLDFVNYVKPKVQKGLCEVGIHVHAWNNPPLYVLNGKYNGNPYLIEYPIDVMREKFKTTYDLISKYIGKYPVSHRSGRWAMNADYFKILEEFAIKVDCSYTPNVSWDTSEGETISGGSDYRRVNMNAHMVGEILEVPVTIRRYKHYMLGGSPRHCARTLLKGGNIWLRPALCTLNEMKYLAKNVFLEQGNDYLEFMIHSSELMPGGSPYFTTNESIDYLYKVMDSLFNYLSSLGYKGSTLEEYALNHKI